MIVTLTQADIDASRPGDCLRDGIATALRRITGIPWRVDKQYIYPDRDAKRPFVTPKLARQFIEAQDNGQPVKPISFELR